MLNLQMQNQSRSDQSIIINLAINIFQNVGIRRWIDQIEILKKEQIYFEICKIIFPETMIHLFRLKQNNKLTTGQKIQGVIDQIARLINNDLYHISGQAIAQGKLNHLKNFLQLLQALSNNMIVASKDHIEIQTAPENHQSMTLDDHDSFYTVLGIDRQFQKIIYYSEQDESEHKKPENQKVKHQKVQKRENNGERVGIKSNDKKSSSSDDQIIKPKKNYSTTVHKNVNKSTQQKTRKQKNYRKTPLFSISSTENQTKVYPTPLFQRNENAYENKNRKWVEIIKNMNETKLALEKQKMFKVQNDFFQWSKSQQENLKDSQKKIIKQSTMRKKLINSKIEERQSLLQAFKGEKPTIQTIKIIFRKEKVYRRQQMQKSRKREAQNIKQLMNFKEVEHLLRKAIISNKEKPSKVSSQSNSDQRQSDY